MTNLITPEQLHVWAGLLLNWSLDGIKANERVMLKGEPITLPLLEALSEGVIMAGGLPDLYLVSPNNNRGAAWGADMARHGTPEQVEQVPQWLRDRYDAMDKYVEVMGTERPGSMRDLPREMVQAIGRATKPMTEVRLGKPWVLTLFPTLADATNEGMGLQEYADLLVRASTADHSAMAQTMEEVRALMDEAVSVCIVTQCPDDTLCELTMKIPHGIRVCDGRRNFPDGEVFTSPDANTVRGSIFVDLPIVSAGERIRGIFLELGEGGRIVKHWAEEGGDRLDTIIGMDENSNRLGEVAFGMNTGLDRVLTHPLYVEKVAGTLHIAIGSSYKECYGEPGSDELEAALASGACNVCTPHVDIVADARPDGCVKSVVFTMDDKSRVELSPQRNSLLWTPAR